MRTRLATTVAALAIGTLALTGCSEAQDAVESAAGGLATSAASKAAEVAQQAAKQQVCRLASDGQISSADLSGLRGAVTAAEQAGVSTSITEPARQIVDSGGNPPQEAIDKVKAECAKA